MNLLGAMVGWKGYAAAGGVAAVLAGLAVYQVTTWRADARYANLVASNAVVMQAYADRATAAEERERTEEQRRQDEKSRIDNETREQVEKSRASAIAAGTERDRMRKQLDGYAARVRAARADTAPVAAGQTVAGEDPLDLLVGVLQRHSDELVEVGGYADEIRDKAIGIERKYNSLIPGNAP